MTEPESNPAKYLRANLRRVARIGHEIAALTKESAELRQKILEGFKSLGVTKLAETDDGEFRVWTCIESGKEVTVTYEDLTELKGE